MTESFFMVAPFAGINRRFPEHKISNEKKQMLRELNNMLSLDGRFKIVGGASRLDANDKGGFCSWAKRMYYNDGADFKRYLFAIINNKFYKLNESTQTLNQVEISGSKVPTINPGVYPISTTVKSNDALCQYLVDGINFYKFLPNEAGRWEIVNTLSDVDGIDINPIFNCEWLDRQWVLVSGRNVILGSANLQPENFSDATDSILLELPPGNGGYPRGLIKYRGTLYVFHDDYFARITGTSASTFGIRPEDVIELYGCSAGRSLCLFNNKIVFLNSKDNEIYTTAGTFDSTDQIPLSYDIIFSQLINPNHAQDTVIHFDNSLKCLRVAYYPTGGTNFGDEEIYSVAEQKWCGQTRGRNISCYAQWNGLGDDLRLTTGRADKGLVMWNDATINFDGNPIHFRWVGASNMPCDPFEFQMEEVIIDMKPVGDTSIDIRYYIDSRLTTVGDEEVNQEGEGITLGLINIGEQNIFTNRFTPLVDRSQGRMIRFQIEGQVLNQLFEFYALYVFYNKQQTKFSKLVGGQ